MDMEFRGTAWKRVECAAAPPGRIGRPKSKVHSMFPDRGNYSLIPIVRVTSHTANTLRDGYVWVVVPENLRRIGHSKVLTGPDPFPHTEGFSHTLQLL